MPYASRVVQKNWLAPAVVVAAFLAYSLPPYFTGGTRVPATFALHYPLLVGHVMFASVAMVTAVAQVWPALHRRSGRVYVFTVRSATPLQDSVFGGNQEHFVWFVAGVGAWLGRTIPFVTVQWWLNRKSAIPPSSISQLTDTQRV